MKLPLPLLSLLATANNPASAFSSVVRTASPALTSARPTTALSAGIDVDPSRSPPRESSVNTMQEWAAQCGIQRTPGLQIVPSVDNGVHADDWCAMTTEPLAEGSPVLQVPPDVMLSSTRAEEEMGGDASLQEAMSYLGRMGAMDSVPQFLLFVKVLTLYEMGDQSPWFPWLNSMPRLFYNAVSMTSFCYECLPPLVYRYARAERVKFDNFVDALKKVDFVSEEVKEDEDVLKWVYNVVQTRSWEGPDGKERLIVPVADMFNHGTDAQVSIGYNDDGDCVAYTSRDVDANSPLCMSYGDPTNPSLLFALYGFLDDSSPATFCKITNIQPNDELRNLGYDFSRMLFHRETGDISPEVWDVMLYQVLATKNKNDQQAFYEAHMSGDDETKNAYHRQYFADTSEALLDHVDTFLGQLDDLGAKAEGMDLNEHPRLPLILRHNQFVRETFLTVKERLDPMVAEARVAEYA